MKDSTLWAIFYICVAVSLCTIAVSTMMYGLREIELRAQNGYVSCVLPNGRQSDWCKK